MKYLKSSVTAFAVMFIAFSAFAGKMPKYVFLFIGDGMSTPQRLTAEEYSIHLGRGELKMNHLPKRAETVTKSANQVVTDSAAAATAIACGVKTNNGMLGLDPEKRRLESSAEVAKKSGRKVGIITTVTINHATPAGFYAHRATRGDSRNIAMDLVNCGFDFFCGGGIGGWKKPTGGYYNTDGVFIEMKDDGSPIPEGEDPYTLWRRRGVYLRDDLAGFRALKPGRPVWCMFGDGNFPYDLDTSADYPTPSEMVAKAIELLDGEAGFFIMCEGGHIDHAGHANDAAANIRDILALDAAVKTAYEFYEKHPGETLIITTGDHETGGLISGVAGTGRHRDLSLLDNQKCSVAAFADRLKAAKVTTAEAALPLIKRDFGLDLTEAERNRLEEILVKHAKNPAWCVADFAKRTLAERAGITWSHGGHSALPTLTTAVGCGAEIIDGMKDNTDIGLRLKKLLAR